jgi:hypothetical protein
MRRFHAFNNSLQCECLHPNGTTARCHQCRKQTVLPTRRSNRWLARRPLPRQRMRTTARIHCRQRPRARAQDLRPPKGRHAQLRLAAQRKGTGPPQTRRLARTLNTLDRNARCSGVIRSSSVISAFCIRRGDRTSFTSCARRALSRRFQISTVANSAAVGTLWICVCAWEVGLPPSVGSTSPECGVTRFGPSAVDYADVRSPPRVVRAGW